MAETILFETENIKLTSSLLINGTTSVQIGQIDRFQPTSIETTTANWNLFGYGLLSLISGIIFSLIVNINKSEIAALVAILSIIGGLIVMLAAMGIRKPVSVYEIQIWTAGGFSTTIRTKNHDIQNQLVSALRQAITEMKSPAGAGKSVADEIRALVELQKEGILNEEDIERAKNLFLGKPPDRREETIRVLEQLHQLHRQGVLSDSEFNMKKWDVLSKP